MRLLLNCLTLIILAQPVMATGVASPLPPFLLECPLITVDASNDLVCPSEEVTFSASLKGGAPSINPTFNWTVSAGTIISGQGTPTIKVLVSDAQAASVSQDNNITATVEVGGFTALTASCASKAFHTILKASCCYFHRKFDEFGDISFNDEKARLRNLVLQMQNEPGVLGYVLIYAGRHSRVDEAKRRLERAKNYLVNEGGIIADRILTIDGGYREDLTVELWVAPAGAPPLTPDKNTTIDPGEEQILNVSPRSGNP